MCVHFGSLGIKQNIKKVWIDKETRGKSIGIILADGTTDYMPYDQPLAIIKDPEYMLQNHIEHIIAQIKEVLEKKKNLQKIFSSTACYLRQSNSKTSQSQHPQ